MKKIFVLTLGLLFAAIVFMQNITPVDGCRHGSNCNPPTTRTSQVYTPNP